VTTTVLGAVCWGGYGVGLARAADRAFPEGGDCGKGLAGVVAESVEHVCRKSAPGLRGGASGRTGNTGVGQDQQIQVSLVEVGADDPGSPYAVDEHQPGVEGPLGLGREDLGPELGGRGRDFLAAEKFPHLIFVLSSVAPSPTAIQANGTLTVRDKTRPIVFEATVSTAGDSEITVTSQLNVDRGEYDVSSNPLGAGTMNNSVGVTAVFSRA
jgi:YceI-like domain